MKASFFWAAAGGLIASPALGQATLYEIAGVSSAERLGSSVAAAGDFDNDGFDDVIVGSPGAMNGGLATGSAQVVSGADGMVLMEWFGAAAGAGFGAAVDGVGDINNDGHGDVVVTATGVAAGTGEATVYSGIDGSVLFTFPGRAANDFFGVSAAGVGDVNDDGTPDIGIGALGFDFGGPNFGMVEIYSGLDGLALITLNGAADDTLGFSLDGVGDVNADGFDDFVIGVPSLLGAAPVGGEARVISGRDEAVLFTWSAPLSYTNSTLGHDVAGVGDVDMDGTPDIAVGNYAATGPGLPSFAGQVTVYSGLTGTTIYTWDGREADDQFGWSVSGAGDVDGDGFADVVAGAPFSSGTMLDPGEARVYSGSNGQEIYTLQGTQSESFFGYSVGGGMDVNGDGFSDFVVGANQHSAGATGTGRATIHTGNLGSVGGYHYCIANANSLGQVAQLNALGSRVATDNLFTLQVTGIPDGQFAFFLASRGQDQVNNPGGSDGNLCLGGGEGIARILDSLGQIGANQYHAEIDLTNVPEPPAFNTIVLAGETWNFQAWYRDNGSTNNFSNGLGVLFQ